MNQFYNQFDIAPRYENGGPRPDDYRTPFQIDRDRIIYTSAFESFKVRRKSSCQVNMTSIAHALLIH